MTGYHCPVEGCDYGTEEDRSLASMRSHINAKPGEHDWSELREQVEQQPEAAAHDGSEDDDPEAGGEQAEAGESGPSEQADEGAETVVTRLPDGSAAFTAEIETDESNDEMPTDDEYQQQQAGESPDNGGDDESLPEPAETNDEQSASSGTAEAAAAATAGAGYLGGVNPLVVAALAVGVLLVVALYLSEGNDEQPNPPTAEDSEAGDEPAEAAPEQAGGLR